MSITSRNIGPNKASNIVEGRGSESRARVTAKEEERSGKGSHLHSKRIYHHFTLVSFSTGKSKKTCNHQDDNLPDQITLRDELYQLKREMTALTKSHERNLIRLRKYEEETRRKDRQIEQLVDPSRNENIQEFLSMKGAAMLLNLKDQNSAFLQLIVEKNHQIKRLVHELRTARLYSSNQKLKFYRAEVTHLRNLLLTSQETVKAASASSQVNFNSKSMQIEKPAAVNQQQSTTRKDPVDDLHFAVQALERQVEYSNNLLIHKNHEIMMLRHKLQQLTLDKKNPLEVTQERASAGDHKTHRRCYSASILEISPPRKNLPVLGKKMSESSKKQQQRLKSVKARMKRRVTVSAKLKWKGNGRKQRKLGHRKITSEPFVDGKVIHSNPNADDNFVWTVIQEELKKLESDEKSVNRKTGLPVNIEKLTNSDKITKSQPELIFFSRNSIDSSSSSFEENSTKLLQVEVEINAAPADDDAMTTIIEKYCKDDDDDVVFCHHF